MNDDTHSSRFEKVATFAGLAFLLVLAGMLVVRFDLPPSGVLDRSIKAARAVGIQLGWIQDQEVSATTEDGERESKQQGLGRFVPERAWSGYTVVTSANETAASLIDMNGNVVHRWELPLATIRATSPKPTYAPDVAASWRSFHLYPNGDLVAVLQCSEVTPYGLGLFKIDKDSRLLWANHEHAHHDVVVADDGRIYTVTQAIRDTPVAGLPGLKPPFLDDAVLVTSAEGKTLHKVSVSDALAKTKFASAVRRLVNHRDWKGDYFHVNSIEPHVPAISPSVMTPGQVLVSVRNIDALAVIDLGSESVEWLWRGSWHRQHDPDILPDGRIMLFDNRGDFARGARSRIVEFDPVSQGITWQAGANPQVDLYSGWGANQQPLPNGNVLINEGAAGRLVEVTREGDVVWEYFNPARSEDGKIAAPILEARRYAPDTLAFEFNRRPAAVNQEQP